MQTRSKTRALAKEPIVIVTSSATGLGTHTRWQYPGDTNVVTSGNVLPSIQQSMGPSFPSASKSDSVPTISTLSPASTVADLSDDGFYPQSFHTPVTRNAPLVPATPRKLVHKPLQRSPGQIWTSHDDNSSRFVLVDDDLTREGIQMRESMMEVRLQEIFETQLENLMEVHRAAYEQLVPNDEDVQETDVDTEEEDAGGSTARHPRVLGPHGTEIIDPEGIGRQNWMESNRIDPASMLLLSLTYVFSLIIFYIPAFLDQSIFCVFSFFFVFFGLTPVQRLEAIFIFLCTAINTARRLSVVDESADRCSVRCEDVIFWSPISDTKH